MIRNALIAAAILISGPAFAETSVQVPDSANAVQVAASVPASIPAEARSRIENLLKNADAAETAGDQVLSSAWQRLARDEIEAAVNTSAQIAEVR